MTYQYQKSAENFRIFCYSETFCLLTESVVLVIEELSLLKKMYPPYIRVRPIHLEPILTDFETVNNTDTDTDSVE